jgi:putative addiction module antidote
MHALKLRAVGTSTGVVLPKELLARLKVGKGDVLFATETPSGVLLTPYDEKVATQMEAAREIMKRRRNVLRELAK